MSGGEILLILIVALIVFGPKRLPELGRTIGKVMSELNKTLHDVKDQMADEYQTQHEETKAEPAQPAETGKTSADKSNQENKENL